jgi:alpha-glucosidase
VAGPWWQEGVIYQVYTRSFADSDGDGVGDLAGITSRLDHLAWLGVDGLWLTPITVSPDADWGYDVSDYCAVQPALGTLDDLDRLVAEAGARGIRVMLDLVPNHTSDRHPWFVDSRSSRRARHRHWYVWADGRGAGPPNNWLSSFGGPAWTFDETTGQWYLHNFLPAQPDLDWWNEEVRRAFDAILRFWFDRGVAGFRIDVSHMIVKDAELRDNPPAEPSDHPYVRAHGQRKIYNAERPEAHDVFRRWRALADGYDPPRVLLGETYVLDVSRLTCFYGKDDELHLAGNFVFLHAPFTAEDLRAVVEAAEEALPHPCSPVWAVSTHDLPRFPTRWCGGRPEPVRCVLMMLLGLRGTPILYYGDELGMPDTDLGSTPRRDQVGRDPCRTPMPWTDAPGGGFTPPGVKPWLPLGDTTAVNVAGQQTDPRSTLHLCRRLIALRRESADLRVGEYATVPTGEGLWAWRRGRRTAVALNLSGSPGEVEGLGGRICISTGRNRDGEVVSGGLRLAPWEGAIMELD